MKIVQILFNKNFGGVEQCFVDYCEALMLLGHEVHNVIQLDAAYKPNLAKINNNIYELDTKFKLNPLNLLKLRSILCRIKPDVVICHTGKAAIINKLATCGIKKYPIIGIDHGERAMNYVKRHKADYVFAVNTWLTKQINDLNMGVKAFNIPNMVRIPKGFKMPAIKWHKPPVVGILSRISYEKHIEQIISALDILRGEGLEVKLAIGGTGRREEFMRNEVKRLKLQKQVVFKGWVKDKKRFFEQIDIFCMPSEKETFGIAYLDAMKHGNPIIASDTWGPSDIFENEKDALVISRAKPLAMNKPIAEAIKRLIQDKKLAQKLAKNGFEKVKNYTIEENAKRIKKALDFVMKDYRGKRSK